MIKYLKLGIKLFPIFRSITGSGVNETLKILKKEIKNLKVKKIQSGTRVYDWKVPPEWNIKDAYVQDKNGKKIIDIKNNNLHLISYSQPIKKFVTRDELFERLHFLKNQKSAIPYITSYYNKYWGFCISYNNFIFLKKKYKKKDKFFVKINSSFKKKGNLTYGELFIEGKSKKEILISTNICHPSMANNELSGPLVATALIKYFSKYKKLSKSIRFLFIPETIGSIAYIKKNFKNLKKNVIGGYTLSCIGDNRSYSYLYTKYKNSLSDKAAEKAFKKLKIKYKKYLFLKRGSDERQFNSPGVDLNIGSIMRSRYTTFPEYHTSLDNFDLVSAKGLYGGYSVVKESIKILMELLPKDTPEVYGIFAKRNPVCRFKCEPFLRKRKLYPILSFKKYYGNFSDILLNFLQYADGKNSLEKISRLIKITPKKCLSVYKILSKNNLIKLS